MMAGCADIDDTAIGNREGCASLAAWMSRDLHDRYAAVAEEDVPDWMIELLPPQ